MPLVQIGTLQHNNQQLILNVETTTRQIFVDNKEIELNFFNDNIRQNLVWTSENHKNAFEKLFLPEEKELTISATPILSVESQNYPSPENDFITITNLKSLKIGILSLLFSTVFEIFIIIFLLALQVFADYNIFILPTIIGLFLFTPVIFITTVIVSTIYRNIYKIAGITFTTD